MTKAQDQTHQAAPPREKTDPEKGTNAAASPGAEAVLATRPETPEKVCHMDRPVVGDGADRPGRGLHDDLSEQEARKLAKIMLKYHKKKEDVISLLQDIQDEFGYLPKAVLHVLSKEIHVPEHEIYGVATFYSQFTFNEPGRHKARVCLGTACHVRGAVAVLEEVQRDLGIKPGGTTRDGGFSLETVMCLGACALGPVVVVDDAYHGGMTPAKARKLIQDLRQEDGA